MTRIATRIITDPAFASILVRHRAFWERADHDSLLRSSGVFAPSVPVHLPQADGPAITRAERLEAEMVDPAALIDELEAWDIGQSDPAEIAQRQTLAFLGMGDVLPFSQPFFKVPWIEAVLGCPIKMTEGQIWVERYERDPEELIRCGVCLEDNPWFELYIAFLRQLQERIGDRYPVSANTLFRGPSDLVAALLGVQETCVGWIERPAFMARLMRLCTDANLAMIRAGNEALEPFAGGYVSGYGIWTSSPVVRTQADHSSLLSPQMYREQILPYDREVVQACPSCIFHIHNNGLHVAPFLVQIDELDAIEVVVDPYPDPERKGYEVEMLQQIQEHKPLILDVNFPSVQEAEWLFARLAPRGLCFNARFAPETFPATTERIPGSEMWRLRARTS